MMNLVNHDTMEIPKAAQKICGQTMIFRSDWLTTTLHVLDLIILLLHYFPKKEK
jgi:hypothetical protein